MTTGKNNVVAFVAWSGTGKTTLVEKVVRELKNRGYSVGFVKHDSHGFDIDTPGKDSYRMAAAGADTVVVASAERVAVIKRHCRVPSVEAIIEQYFDDVDIVIVEGFKRSSLPKIEVHRQSAETQLICRGEANDPNLIAVASDVPLLIDVPLYDIEDFSEIAGFIEETILRKSRKPEL